MAVQSYTPQRANPSFTSGVQQVLTRATYSTAANLTYAVSDIVGGFINRDTNGAARTDTLPTAAALIPQLQGPKVGTTVKFFVKNTAGAANSVTLAPGTGGTAVGTMSVAQSNIKEFALIVTGVPDYRGNGGSYDLVSLGTSAF